MDLILTGRQVSADECLEIGLATKVCSDGDSLETAMKLARDLARFPQGCMRADRLSAIRQWSLDIRIPLSVSGKRGGSPLRRGGRRRTVHIGQGTVPEISTKM